ncbi:MAG: glutamine synthetase [Proteobacteria bacterium]|nr:glutamine synthetase [Pseudomonadota bacterium]
MTGPLAKLPKEAADFLAAHPETRTVDAIFADLSGIVRGKRYPIDHLAKLYGGEVAMPASVYLLDVTGESHDPGGRGFSDGDPDAGVRIVPGSLKPVPWADRPGCQVMITLVEEDQRPYPFEPRNLLARVAERFAELDLRPVVAFELEFYLVDRERGPDGAPQPPVSPVTGVRDRGTQVYGMAEIDAFAALLDDIAVACAAQDIPTSAMTAEYAPGQFEINLQHVADPMLAADHCVLFKRAVKGVARRHGVQASFMAKPYLDQTGCGLHLHISLQDQTGRNVFDGGDAPASATLEHALGGILDIMPESMAFLAPNVNSFRRYQPNVFVPIRRAWGFENRSTALRIPLGRGDARRIEHRIAGADANPYLALASALAGIHHGIVNEIAPPPAFEGNAGFAFDEDLPFRPRPALARLVESEVLADYLGPEYPRLYAACKTEELEAFERHIGAREYAWYLQPE